MPIRDPRSLDEIIHDSRPEDANWRDAERLEGEMVVAAAWGVAFQHIIHMTRTACDDRGRAAPRIGSVWQADSLSRPLRRRRSAASGQAP